jgi:RNA polymerase sigma-70 factor (ECF subfamily)
MAHAVSPALVDGAVGLVFAPGGKLGRALKFTIADGRIVDVDIVMDPARLQAITLGVLD